MSYATPADLLARFDESDISDLASDSGTPVADLATNSKILAALADASGRIDAALMQSNHYTADDLASLTGNSLAFLKRITCDLAMAFLMGRRPEKYGSDFFKNLTENAENWLDLIRKGHNLFDIDRHKEAGLAKIDGPTAAAVNRLNLIPSRVRNFYPNVAGRLPHGRGGA